MSIKLYWNNICLISKLEEEVISNQIIKSPTPIEVSYFGLGRPKSMLQHFMDSDSISADIIVSTDTDVFHDKTYAPMFTEFSSFSKFITIPLVLIYNQETLGSLTPPKTFEDLFSISYRGKYTFGGFNNSAGKSLIKSLWFKYGYEKTKLFADHAVINSMPATAFYQVMTGAIPIAIVPTIFSLRAGIGNLKMVWPEDGAIPIHSYTTKKNSLSKSVDDFFENALIGKDFQQLLVEKAAILPSHREVSNPVFVGNKTYHLMEPDWDFLTNIDHQELYKLLGPTTIGNE